MQPKLIVVSRTVFVSYGVTVAVLAIYLMLTCPQQQRAAIVALALFGWLVWSAIEYGMHRFVLHGLQPVRAWHAAHHLRPRTLVIGSALLSTMLIAILIVVPALLMENPWHALALSLGLQSGYLGYAITHHAIHHWHLDNAWLKERQRWHEQHHQSEHPGCFGVTSSFWDWVFGSTRPSRA